MSSSVETTEDDKVNTGALGTIVVVGALAMVGIAAALTALVRSEQSSLDSERGRTANLREVAELRAEQRSRLAAPPAWVDKETQRVSLPIDRARQMTMEQLQRNPYAASPLPPQEEDVNAGPDAGAEAAATDAGAAEEPATPDAEVVPAPQQDSAPKPVPPPTPPAPAPEAPQPSPTPAPLPEDAP